MTPPLVPKVPRKDDGSIDGQSALFGLLDTISTAGEIRLQLLGLIAAERARQAVQSDDKGK